MNLLVLKNLRDMQRRPLRTLLTVVGVLLGVAGIVAISYTGRNLADAQRETYASTRQPDITGYALNLSPTLVDLIERRENVAIADTRAVQNTRASVGDGWVTTQIIGVDDFQSMALSSVELVEGSFPGRGEVVFDVTATNLLDLKIGDIIALQETARDQPTEARVVGFVRAPATLDAAILNRATAFMPGREVRRLLGFQYDNYLMLRVQDRNQAEHTSRQINSFLAKRGISTGTFTVRNPNEFTGSRELGTLLLLLQVFSVVGAVLSSFLVSNTIAAVMVEETRQIGIIKALGGTRWTAMYTYLIFAVVVGLLGAGLGWLLGLLGGRLLTSYLADISGLVLPGFSLSYRELALALGVGLGVSVGSALIPTWMAARQRVVRMLANLGVVADYRRGLVQRLTEPLVRYGAMAAIGTRNLTRRPVRAWVTLAVVSIAVASFISTQAVSTSVTTTVDSLYELYGADGWIFFENRLAFDFDQTLEQHPDIVTAEPWINASGSIGSVSTDVWAVPEHSTIYTPRLIEGTWVRQTSPIGAVFTSNLAARLDARLGDVRTLDVGDKSTVVQVIGIVDDESTYLGASSTGKVFVRPEDGARLTGRDARSNLWAIKLVSPEHDAVDHSLERIEQDFRQYGPATLAFYRDRESSQQAISILTLMLNAMVIIIGVVGLAGIINTLIINLTERRREYGVLRSLGATSGHLIRLVMTEALALAAAGCLVGTIVGYPLAHYMVDLTGQQLFGLQFALGPATIIGTFIVALGATAAVSTGPGLVASRIRPIQVLRYE